VACISLTTFPRIGELPYLLTLPGHGFYWFQLPPVREEDR
jgi:maltose alpha-D-glucosyltransferase / alpha-amylase